MAPVGNAVAPRPASTASVISRTAPRAEIEATYKNWLEAIPLAESDDGFGILASILTVQKFEDLLGEQSSLPKAEAMCGHKMRVDKIERRASDLDNNDWYLVVHSVNMTTAEKELWQTSAGTPQATLVTLHHRGELPAIVELRKSVKKTAAGFYPINMIVHDYIPAS